MERGEDYHDSRPPEKPLAQACQTPPVGALLKQRFLLTRQVAQGGTATVYHARDRLKERDAGAPVEVGVKFFHKTSANIPALTMAAREATLARTVRHPGIIHIHDMHAVGDRACLTMEWIRGETLAEHLARMPGGRLPPEQAIQLAMSVADTLAACHKAGIAHGDVKPANILLADEGTRLVDFTTAHQFANGPGSPVAMGSEAIAGYSRLYASPRVLQAALPLPCDDIYGLAVVTFQMLEGRTPFAPHSSLTAREQGLTPGRPASLGRLRWRVLRRGFAADARMAPDDVVAFARALNHPLRGLGQ